MGIKVQRVVNQAHTVIEPGKKISVWKFHQITGQTAEHLLRPTAKYKYIETTGQLSPFEICSKKYHVDLGTGSLLISALSNMIAWEGKGTGRLLLMNSVIAATAPS